MPPRRGRKRRKIPDYPVDDYRVRELADIPEWIGVPKVWKAHWDSPRIEQFPRLFGDDFPTKVIVSKACSPRHDICRERTNAFIRSGDLVKPDRCQLCGGEPVETHHRDLTYTDPSAIDWLCPRCHRRRHS